MLAHAINLMAKGSDSPSIPHRSHRGAVLECDSHDVLPSDDNTSAENTPVQRKTHSDDIGNCSRINKTGPLAELTTLVNIGDIRHKMDAFDVDALNQLVGKLIIPR